MEAAREVAVVVAWECPIQKKYGSKLYLQLRYRSSKKVIKADALASVAEVYQLARALDSFIMQVQKQQDIQKIVTEYEKILSDRTEIDALISYSTQRWRSYTQKTGD